MAKKEIYHILSNTHWDREWYQSHEKYLVRLISLFDRLLDTMEKEPEYRFITDGQFALVEDYIEARPEKKPLIEKLIKNGQLLVGPWYTQPLQNIVGGEALVRNLQYGTDKADALGGAMRFSYEIDEFGHASQMPQIYNGFGITGSMAWRGNPKGSKSIFEWVSPDGSSVYMFYSKKGYGFATTLPMNTEDFTENIDGVEFKRRGLKNRVNALREYTLEYSETDNMFWLNGIDHSFAQTDLLRVIDKIRELFPDIEVKQSTPVELEKEARADLKEKGIIPVKVEGELLFTYEDILESTNALHPRQKQRHALSEYHLTRRFEPLNAFADILGGENKSWALDRAWRYVLENHAHDSLGCCSVDEVFNAVMTRYEECISLSEQCEDEALRYIMSCSDENPAVYIFNLSSYAVKGAKRVKLSVPEGFTDGFFRLFAPDGEEVKVSVINKINCGDVRYNPRRGHPTWGRKWVFDVIINMPEVSAYGWTKLKFVKAEDEKRVSNRRYYNLEKGAKVMENEYLRLVINSDGTFDLTDKVTGRTYPSQLIFEDTGEAGDIYVHTEPFNDTSRLYASLTGVACLFDAPLGVCYGLDYVMYVPDGLTADRKSRSEIKKELKIKTTLTLLKGVRRVDINIHCENASRNHRLRVMFPSMLCNAEYSRGTQAFDFPARKIHTDFDKDLPREQDYATKPMLGLCAVSEEAAGLAVAAKGIFEYECTDDDTHALAITLVRAIDIIDQNTFAITPEYICSEAQNLTDMDFEISLIPNDGDYIAIQKMAEEFLNPAGIVFNRKPEISVLPDYEAPEKHLPDTGSIFEINGEGVTVTTFKKTKNRNSYVIRLLNNTDTPVETTAEITLPDIAVKEMFSLSLDENRIEKITEGNIAQMTIAPHKLFTLEIVL